MQVFAAEALQGGSDAAERCPNWPVMTVRIPIVGLPLRCSTAPTTSSAIRHRRHRIGHIPRVVRLCPDRESRLRRLPHRCAGEAETRADLATVRLNSRRYVSLTGIP